jgi:hypothetical protein
MFMVSYIVSGLPTCRPAGFPSLRQSSYSPCDAALALEQEPNERRQMATREMGNLVYPSAPIASRCSMRSDSRDKSHRNKDKAARAGRDRVDMKYHGPQKNTKKRKPFSRTIHNSQASNTDGSPRQSQTLCGLAAKRTTTRDARPCHSHAEWRRCHAEQVSTNVPQLRV